MSLEFHRCPVQPGRSAVKQRSASLVQECHTLRRKLPGGHFPCRHAPDCCTGRLDVIKDFQQLPKGRPRPLFPDHPLTDHLIGSIDLADHLDRAEPAPMQGFGKRRLGQGEVEHKAQRPCHAPELIGADPALEFCAPDPGQVIFVGINRLAELLLRANPHIRRALVATYPFVFVDEFQDTTYAQYDFLLSAFFGGQTVITGVGDDKQRIMVFAGARQDAFQRLQADFGGARFPLLFNFRSSPDLVAIQHVVARALDPNTVPTVAQTARQVDGDVAQVWSSQTKAAEATHLAQWIANDMATRGRAPRDYALLVKQKSDDYERELAGAFAANGLRIRNESHTLGKTSLQDLLSDDLSRLAIATFRLGASRRAPAAWQLVSSSVLALRATAQDDDARAAKVEADLTAFLTTLRTDMAATAPSRQSAVDFAKRVFEYLDLGAIARTYAEYGVGDLLQIILEAFCIHFFASADGAPNWTACLDAFEGVNQIPMMTVHKSKGLEYDTIIFVGLDDRAWWAHTPGDPEGVAAFFVALSRAKQRAIFAFCQQRGERNNVAELYQLLTHAGVPEIAI